MTAQQFWMMKADQISDSWKTIEEKSEALAVLLKTAYKPKKQSSDPHEKSLLPRYSLDKACEAY